MFRQIVIVENQRGSGIAFPVILDNFKEEKLGHLASPFRKFIFLKLFYKCVQGIHRETLKTPEALEQFRNLLDAKASGCLTKLMSQLVNDLSQLCNQLDAIQNNNLEFLESNLNEIFSKLTDNYFFDTAKYIFKIYSFYNLISKYTPLGDFNVVILSRHFHQICKNLLILCLEILDNSISSILINSGLIKKIQSIKEVENVLVLTHVTEKHLMASIEHRITKLEDVEIIFDHFLAMYFSSNDQLVFFGEKFVNYDELSNNKYLEMVCETEIYSKLKFYEEKLLTNCLNTLSCILVNFGYSLGV